MKKIILLTIVLTALYSCKTTEPVEEEIVIAEEAVSEPVPEEKPVEEEIEAEPVIEEEKPEPETDKNEGIEVSEELYNRTFDEIESLIDELTKLIRKKNFNGWKKFLSEKYMEKVGSAEYLREVSESPSLKDVVELKTLRDYFQWVVVPSRASARLDEILFKDETHVTAYMYIEGNPAILFQFELIDGEWAVTVW
jgi:hypothetical protein